MIKLRIYLINDKIIVNKTWGGVLVSLLKSISSELHHIIESIHAIIDIDITIVDQTYKE